MNPTALDINSNESNTNPKKNQSKSIPNESETHLEQLSFLLNLQINIKFRQNKFLPTLQSFLIH